ncbi:MAG: S8 family serine peptidase [Cyanobacteria bacterium J06592_8]
MKNKLSRITQLISLTALCLCDFSFSTPAQASDKESSQIDSFLFSLIEENNSVNFLSEHPLVPFVPQVYDGYIVIDAVAQEDGELLYADLLELGLKEGSIYENIVSGLFPVDNIPLLNNINSLHRASMSMSQANIGTTTSQGVVSIAADQVRSNFEVDGSGVKVGILSNSFDVSGGAADGVLSGDLPGIDNPNGYTTPVQVLQEGPENSIDEGRAIAEIVHDVAPGAEIAFATTEFGQANFANNILNLAASGANVIVDDIIYFAEPMFQDGIIAQAVDQVVNDGVTYFSFAGNNARDSYQSEFTESFLIPELGTLHDFDPGPDIDFLQSIEFPRGTTLLSYQWDEPFFSVTGEQGASSDINIYLFTENGNLITSSTNFNIGDDPVEIIIVTNNNDEPETANLAITLFEGEAPSLQKYVLFGLDQSGASRILDFPTDSSSSYGHSNAQEAIAVGAAFYQDTPAFGQNPPLLESFSSAGGTPILFDTNGNRLDSAEIRLQPRIVAPDGGNTTFFPAFFDGEGNFITDVEGDGFPNFFGTSASAPHAAAVAALMIEANPTITPEEIGEILATTAIDMGIEGFDFDTGYGFINAQAALEVATVPEPGTVFGLLVISGLGLVTQIKKKA